MHKGKPVLLGVLGLADARRNALHLNGAGYGGIDAVEDFDQRALARAVGPHQGVHLALAQAEIHGLEHLVA